jgi:hypothetical protein|tara:strand:- start:486 stop:941 length:456 start_codon:yes stop_codon:yes gene_type:complete
MAINKLDTGAIQDNAITNAKMADDAVGVADLAATGTASITTFLRGDNTWAIAAGNPWASTSSNITIAANDRYFVDTTAGVKTITLPASPQVGDQVSLLDLAGTFDTNNLTIARNSLKIMGLAEDLVVSTENAGIQLVYTGSTHGWKLTTNL